MGLLTPAYGSSGAGEGGDHLTDAQLAIINNWSYDEATNTMTTDSTLEAGLNSFRLGGMHTNSSGGENTFWHNEVSHINWFPVWQGIRHYGKTENENVQLHPTARIYSPANVVAMNGIYPTEQAVSYAAVITLDKNESIYGIQVKAAEDYSGELTYTLRNGTQTGIVKYRQTITVNVQDGDAIEFEFSHPQETHDGSLIAVDIKKENGQSLLVKSGTIETIPWLLLSMATFTDERIAMREDLLDLVWQINTILHPDGDEMHLRDQEMMMTRNSEVIEWDITP